MAVHCFTKKTEALTAVITMTIRKAPLLYLRWWASARGGYGTFV